MNPNVEVEIYAPGTEFGVERVQLVCGSFDIDAGVLVTYTDTGNSQPGFIAAAGEWRTVRWL
jgi:hypothetical protein